MKKLFILGALVFGLAATGQARGGGVWVRFGPPPPPRELIVATPGPHYVWVPGYYRWQGNRYAWRRGYWAKPPRHRAVWVPGYWTPQRGGYVWVEGYWR
jgi:hypothetical protein